MKTISSPDFSQVHLLFFFLILLRQTMLSLTYQPLGLKVLSHYQVFAVLPDEYFLLNRSLRQLFCSTLNLNCSFQTPYNNMDALNLVEFQNFFISACQSPLMNLRFLNSNVPVIPILTFNTFVYY
jgi:hypothetical protein